MLSTPAGMASLEDDEYWTHVVSSFPILANGKIPEPCDDETFFEIKNMIKQKNLITMVSANVMHRVLNNMSYNMTNSFWLYFLNEEINDPNVLRNSQEYLSTDYSGFEKFRIAIDRFYHLAYLHVPAIKRVQMLYESDDINMIDHFYTRVRALMQSQLPIKHKTIIYHFYRTAFRIMFYRDHIHYFDVNLLQCPGCYFEKTECICEITIQAFSTTNWQLSSLGIMELLVEDVVMELLYALIENQVVSRTTANYGDSLLLPLLQWVSNVLSEWINKIMEPGCYSVEYDSNKIETTMFKLKYCLYKSFTHVRISQIYDIIIRFPYSDPAVEDLTVSLRNCDLNVELRTLLQNNLKSKLLQPHMSTIDILYVYCSAIKVLRKIDPSGILVQEVAQLIQGFLQGREETVHHIISMLIGNGNNELLRSKTILDEEFDALRNCGHGFCKLIQHVQNSDLVALFIDICGSRELFAHEYRRLLAGRLLVMGNVNTFIREIKHLKLLETKLGESLFNACAMMLKDIDGSRCMNKYLYQEPESHSVHNIFNYNLKFTVKAIIISEHYWPRLEDDFIVNLPEVFLNHLEYYKKCYEVYKRNRTLVWNPNLGKVEMDIIINEKCLSITVSSIQATVIWHFQNKEEWIIDDLSIKMNVPPIALMVFISFWIDKGVLKRKTLTKIVLSKNLPKSTPDYVDNGQHSETVPRRRRVFGNEML